MIRLHPFVAATPACDLALTPVRQLNCAPFSKTTTQVIGVVSVCPFDEPDALDEQPPPINSLPAAAVRARD